MQFVNYFSIVAIPATILIIATYGMIEKKKVFDIFLEGAKEGLKIVLSIFPTLIGLFVAVGVLRSSGVLDIIVNMLAPIISFLKFPAELMPLVMLRPISGSAAMAVAVDMMNLYGVDSLYGKIISTIMGATETTLYTIAIYTAAVGIKKIRYVLVAALIGDMVGMITANIICQTMW